MIRKVLKKTLAFLCAVCMLTSGFGEMGVSVFARREPVILSRTLTASDDRTYEITVAYEIELDEGETPPAQPSLAVRELTETQDADGFDCGYEEYVERTADALECATRDLRAVRVFDIALLDPVTGEELEPQRGAHVSIRLTDERFSEDGALGVVHFGAETASVMDSTVRDGAVEFDTDSFSVYAVAESENTLCTYYFFAYNSFGDYQGYNFYDDQGRTVTSQTIRNGEKLLAPANPPRRHDAPSAEFKGWFVGTGDDIQNPQLESEPFDFSRPQSIGAQDDRKVWLFAVFADYVYVRFHGQYDSATQSYPILETLRVELDDPDSPVSVDLSGHSADYVSADSSAALRDYKFYGWSETKFPTPGQGQDSDRLADTLPVSEDADLYPMFRRVNWLSLVSGNSGTGATYYSPVSVEAGGVLLQSTIQTQYLPTRLGYAFRGWYLDVENEGTNAQSGAGTRLTDGAGVLLEVQDNERGILTVVDGDTPYLQLSKNVTLYAAWEPVKVPYTIVIWKQRATDAADAADSAKTYDWAESFTLEEYPYTDVTLGDDYAYPGYSFNAGKSSVTAQISYDGSTAFHLYFDWDERPEPTGAAHTLTFYFGEGSEQNASETLSAGAALPALPASSETMAGNTFNWYADESCTTRVFFDEAAYARYSDGPKLLYTAMPDRDLTLYGGWEKNWYQIEIDPNHGALAAYDDNGVLQGNGSTYFWKTYQGDYIQEYTWVSRDFVPSESGQYYFVNHDNAYVSAHYGSNRWTYYSTDVSEATELTTYRKEPGRYLASGWYEVHTDGTETPYVFGELITDNVKIRMHWKLSGTYYLHYNTDVTTESGRLIGALSDGSLLPSADGYVDQAELTLGTYADAPEGYTFVGWTVRGDESKTVYVPGAAFKLPGEYAVTVNGNRVIYLDAVYERVKTARLVYEANGGSVSAQAEFDAPEGAVVTKDAANGKVTLAGMPDNVRLTLSDGVGFAAPEGSGAVFAGWNTEPDGSGEHFDASATVYVDVEEPFSLYAEWRVRVYFSSNGGTFSAEGWDGYTLVTDASDPHSGEYYLDACLNARLSEPAGTASKDDGNGTVESFNLWSRLAAGEPEDVYSAAFDFDTDLVTGAMTLYAHYTSAKMIPFHVVSANKVLWDDWRRTEMLRVTEDPLDLTDAADPASYVTAGEGYTFAYVCLSADRSAIGTADRVGQLLTVGDDVVAVLTDGATQIPLDGNGMDGAGRALYFVYSVTNEDNRVKLAYVQEGESGAFASAEGVSNEDGGVTFTISYNGQIFDYLNDSIPGILSDKRVADGAISGEDVSGQILTLSEMPLEISQSGAGVAFNAPPLLDSGDEPLSLIFDSFGVGAASAADANALEAVAQKLFLRWYDGKKQFSRDGQTWSSLSGDTLYAIYRHRGSELRITKAIVADVGVDTGISAGESFDVTVTSPAITRSSYKVEGTGYSTVSATPAAGGQPGSIRLTVRDGSDIRISGLASGSYTVTESHNINYDLQARIDNADAPVSGGSSVTLTLSGDRLVELRNVPYPICRIRNLAEGEFPRFFTLNSALAYAGSRMSGEAEIEMLRDYVIPDWDALEVPQGYSISLTSYDPDDADRAFSVIRDPSFRGAPILTNYGALTLENVALDGNGVATESASVFNAGELTVGSGATLKNANKTGSGGAVYQQSGSLTVLDGAAFTDNSATSGGAVSVYAGVVDISGGSFTGNSAVSGGALLYNGNDSVSISGGSFVGNSAVNGGAVRFNGGVVEISGGSFTGNGVKAGSTVSEYGGAVYVDSANVHLSGGSVSGSRAKTAGGAVYMGSGELLFSGAVLTDNSVSAGSGGGVYAEEGSVTVSGGSFGGNSAANGSGGAIFVQKGTLELSAGTLGGAAGANTAINGAAIFVGSGAAVLSGGSVTANTATAGGAVGVGSDDARLSFSGGVVVSGNTMNGEPSNVYLDRDSADVIVIDGITASAAIGVYVPDSVSATRGVPGAKFASYTSDANKARITNDRDAFDVVSETASKKLYWGKSITVVVRYQANPFAVSGFPPNDANQQFKKTINPYYPVMGEEGYIAMSALAEDLYKNQSLGLSATAAYAGAFLRNVPAEYRDYFTKLSWNHELSRWELTKHDDTTKVALGENTLVVYYAEPAYISIENNTDRTLTVSDLRIGGMSVVNTPTEAGYGMVFAKNGAIRPSLLPVEASDLVLAPGKSVNLLIPGGRNTAYTLTGAFDTTQAQTVKLRTTNSGGTALDETSVSVAADGSFTFPTGKKTLNKAGTYQIIFGEDKQICKITTAEIGGAAAQDYLIQTDADASGKVEYVFKSLNQALDFVKKYIDSNTATIELLTDYLLPASDSLKIPKGYDITLTTATDGTYFYTPVAAGEPRATISRDSENTSSMITTDTGDANSRLSLKDLIIDGKSVRGSSAGGAVSAKFFEVTLENVEFVNVYAAQGGALYVDDWNNGARGQANSKLTATGCVFRNCNCTNSGNRYGGGAIHFFGDRLSLTDCRFVNCYGLDQAGAVFHRVDNNSLPSYTTLKGCTFDNCTARAAGGLELDSTNILVEDCIFEHCVATERNGGGFNVYVANVQLPNFDCTTKVTGCTFTDCHVTGAINASAGNGGGFRSNSKETTVINCSFSNTTTTRYGGGVCFSNTNGTLAEVYGCTFDKCSSSTYGGGIYSVTRVLRVGDTWTDELGVEHTAPMSVLNSTSGSHGGGIYHANNNASAELTVTNAAIDGNTAGGQGGGVYSNARTVTITGSRITNNVASGNGGGVSGNLGNVSYRLTVDSTDVKDNRSGGQGGGIYANCALTLRGGSTVSGNRLSSNTATAADAAGVYLTGVLTLGAADAAVPDSTSVKDNVTAAGAASNLLLRRDGGNPYNHKQSVSVLCSLNGQIRVINPRAATEQFGTRANVSILGFTEENHVFTADSGSTYGVYDRSNPGNLIWRGGVICKLTDANNYLLYLDPDCTDPAVFDRLDHATGGSKLSPLSYLRQSTPRLYRKNEPNPIDLNSETIYLKLLVSSVETDLNLSTGSYSGRKMLVLTTAKSTDQDGYPYTGRAGTNAVILRGNTQKTLLSAGINLTLTNIVLDGGSTQASPRTATANGGLLFAGTANTTVTLGENAVLQNARSTGSGNRGAGVCVDGATLRIVGGAIYNCVNESGNGGAIWKGNNNGRLEFLSGIISHCSALEGGGVYVDNAASFTMSGTAQIVGCSATGGMGGGVYLNKQRSLSMSGGSVTGNSAAVGGGGIFLGYDNNTRLELAGRVVVSGNHGGGEANNVQLGTPADVNGDEWNGVIRANGISRNSHIGIYVPGEESPGDDPVLKDASPYDKHGLESKPFGTFPEKSSVYTDFLYCFVNDRNGLKGGLQLGDTQNFIYWVKIFSLRVTNTVISSDAGDRALEFQYRLTFSAAPDGPAIQSLNTVLTYENSRVDAEGRPLQLNILFGSATFNLRNGESIVVDNLPAEISNGHVYYRVEQLLTPEQKARFTTTTYRSSGTGDGLVVSGTIGENLYREDIDSKYTSEVFFDNLNAICKLTSSKNGGVLLYSVDPRSGHYVPAVYSTLHSDEENGAFDCINARTDYYYKNVFTNRYEKYVYDGSDELRVEMLVGTYQLKKPIVLNSVTNVALTTAERDATDGYPYVGAAGTSQCVLYRGNFNNKPMLSVGGSQAAPSSIRLTDITLDGNGSDYTASNVKGGIVSVLDYCGLTVDNGATLQNSRISGANGAAVYVSALSAATIRGGTIQNNVCTGSANGAAVYVSAFNNNGGVLTITGSPTIRGNSCANGSGAGVYLGAVANKGTARLNISGSPVFSGNTVTRSGYSDKVNGGESYTDNKVRQDLYIAESHENAPVSVTVAGNMTGADGSIWVWAESEHHHKQLKPFAVLGSGVSGGNLKAFRNAQDDLTTENETGVYLNGTLEGDTAGYVYWTGVTGYRRVILRKISDSYAPLKDAQFSVYKKGSSSPYTVKYQNGDTVTLSDLVSLDSGVFWSGELPFGTYYIQETAAPEGYRASWYTLTVDKDGVSVTMPSSVDPRA